MKTFKDSKEQSWDVAITIGSVKRVRDLLSVDLCDLKSGDPPLLVRLSDDVLLIDVLYCLVKEQADARNISDRQFGELMDGKTTVAAEKVFWDELEAFFQSRDRETVAKSIAAFRNLTSKALGMAKTRFETAMSRVDIDKELETIFSELDTKPPESSESNQTAELSESLTG